MRQTKAWTPRDIIFTCACGAVVKRFGAAFDDDRICLNCRYGRPNVEEMS